MKMRAALERHFNAIWYGSSKPGILLRVLSLAYAAWWAKRLVRPMARPPVPVIVVGNLTVGGGGKTPLVIALARHLLDENRQVAVISRGYGGAEPGEPELVPPDGDPGHFGDEPVLIAQTVRVPVWVCRSRRTALEAAVRSGADVVIADDGLQHRALPRSFEICAVDGIRGLGNRRMVPAGPLRQPLSRMETVDLVMIKAGDWQWPGASRYQLEPIGTSRLDGSAEVPFEQWFGTTVDAVCAIAYPEGFFEYLEQAGVKLRSRRCFPDHHAFQAADLAGLKGPILVTAKDAVKLVGLKLELDIHFVRVAAKVPERALQSVDDHLQEFSHEP